MQPGTTARVRIANPDDVELTFSLTMSAAEWRGLHRKLPDGGDAPGQIKLMIGRMLSLADRMDKTYRSTGWSELSPEETR